ncbi:MAG TPA: hypothetical protein VGC87_01070 [Pyrinomonadaceae bacterium]|jgi:hypothetical protein
MSEDQNKRKSRVERVEEAVRILKALALRADERMDDFDSALNNLTVKIEALTDAQIRNEETGARRFEALALAQESLTVKMEALAEVQARSEERLTRKFEALAEAHEALTVNVAALADGLAQTDRRLGALIDIVREGRTGGTA